ncbi:hypothetical protein VTH82DRAFT_5438 [Thermothelomyces myriococcoides]
MDDPLFSCVIAWVGWFALVKSKQRPEPHLQSILQSTRGIAFLGTPHNGTELARWAEYILRCVDLIKQTNNEILGVLQRESEVLARIQDGFHTIANALREEEGQKRIEITCFYEELPLPVIGQQVVPQHSALLPGYIQIGINSDHIGIARFVKTQIALAYVYWLRETHPEISVYWIHASNAERFRQAYASIAEECLLPGYDDPKTEVLPLVKRWLERKGGNGQWLMVIDNADDTEVFFGQHMRPTDNNSSVHEENLGRYIPECAHGAILVTTRNLQTGSRLTRGRCLIEVGEMDEDETAKLLRAHLDGNDLGPDEHSTLSSRLENLPLALIQAAAFIRENGLTIGEYIQLLDRSDQNFADLLSEEFETEGRDSDAPRAVAETWILSFEQIQRQNALAAELLSLMSLFDRQAIPRDFLTRYYELRGEDRSGEIQLTKALGVLQAFCFIVEDKAHGFDMHRLIQLATQKWLNRKDLIRQYAEKALLVVSKAFPDGGNHQNWAICRAYLPHANAVLKLNATGTDEEYLEKASLLKEIGYLYFKQGQWKDAEKYIKHQQGTASIYILESMAI